MIKVTNLSKNFGTLKAVKSINFEINDGEIVGFLGANGAGKTTTLRMITGYLIPTAGNVYVNDLNILENPYQIQKQIGYLPELNPLYLEMSVYDFLQFIANIRDIRGKQFKEAFARVIEQCGLKGVIHKNIAACSKGFKQRIGLAATMIHDPNILIFDEPVTGLDPNQIVEIRELIKKLGKEKLVLISSHILQEIQATVDRIMIIHEGEIVADGTSSELISNFMGNIHLTMEVKNATEESLSNIEKVVPSVTFLNSEPKNDHQILHLEYPRENDPREDLFKYAVNSNWIILSMNPRTAKLEDIFRSLTITGEAARA